MKRHFVFFGMVVLVFAAVASVWAETDPRIGTWKLNVSKSTSSNGMLPASETRTYAAEGNKIMSTSEGVDAKGKPISAHYEATADGKERPTNQSATLSIKQTGPGAYAGTSKRDGKVVSTNVAVISGGGKVFTFKNKGTDAQGQAFTSTVVFEKQ
jgi:uncharacterized iron-regulated membrane protein